MSIFDDIANAANAVFSFFGLGSTPTKREPTVRTSGLTPQAAGPYVESPQDLYSASEALRARRPGESAVQAAARLQKELYTRRQQGDRSTAAKRNVLVEEIAKAEAERQRTSPFNIIPGLTSLTGALGEPSLPGGTAQPQTQGVIPGFGQLLGEGVKAVSSIQKTFEPVVSPVANLIAGPALNIRQQPTSELEKLSRTLATYNIPPFPEVGFAAYAGTRVAESLVGGAPAPAQTPTPAPAPTLPEVKDALMNLANEYGIDSIQGKSPEEIASYLKSLYGLDVSGMTAWQSSLDAAMGDVIDKFRNKVVTVSNGDTTGEFTSPIGDASQVGKEYVYEDVIGYDEETGAPIFGKKSSGIIQGMASPAGIWVGSATESTREAIPTAYPGMRLFYGIAGTRTGSVAVRVLIDGIKVWEGGTNILSKDIGTFQPHYITIPPNISMGMHTVTVMTGPRSAHDTGNFLEQKSYSLMIKPRNEVLKSTFWDRMRVRAPEGLNIRPPTSTTTDTGTLPSAATTCITLTRLGTPQKVLDFISKLEEVTGKSAGSFDINEYVTVTLDGEVLGPPGERYCNITPGTHRLCVKVADIQILGKTISFDDRCGTFAFLSVANQSVSNLAVGTPHLPDLPTPGEPVFPEPSGPTPEQICMKIGQVSPPPGLPDLPGVDINNYVSVTVGGTTVGSPGETICPTLVRGETYDVCVSCEPITILGKTFTFEQKCTTITIPETGAPSLTNLQIGNFTETIIGGGGGETPISDVCMRIPTPPESAIPASVLNYVNIVVDGTNYGKPPISCISVLPGSEHDVSVVPSSQIPSTIKALIGGTPSTFTKHVVIPDGVTSYSVTGLKLGDIISSTTLPDTNADVSDSGEYFKKVIPDMPTAQEVGENIENVYESVSTGTDYRKTGDAWEAIGKW